MTVNTVIAGSSTCTAPYAPLQQPFHTTAFLDGIPGSTTPRSDSERWGDIVNVKSCGAKGDGVTDDTAAINAAIKSRTSNWANGLCGEILFPPGIYITSSPLLIDVYQGLHSIVLRGVGQASQIVGNFADFIIKATNFSTGGLVLIQNLTVTNNHAFGCGVQLYGTVGACIDNCVIAAGIMGIYSLQGNSVSLRQVQVVGSQPSWPAGSCGVYMRGNGAINMIDVTSWDTGVRLSGGACGLWQGRAERNLTGIELGRQQSIFVGSISGTVLTVSSMITDTPDGGGVYGNGPSALIGGASLFGSGIAGGTTITTAGTGTGRTGTYNLSANLGTISSRVMWCLADDQINGACIESMTMESNDTGIYAFDASTCSIRNVSIAGENSSPSGIGSIYGFRANNFASSVLECVNAVSADSSSFQTAAIAINAAGNSKFISCNANSNGGAPGVAWLYPGDRRSMPDFDNCNNPDIGTDFATNAPLFPTIGMRRKFTDANSSTFGAQLASGGSNHVWATRDTSHWYIDGKAD